MRFSKLLAALLTLSFTSCASGETELVKPSGEFAEIETDQTEAAVAKLAKRDKQTLDAVKSSPGNFAPPALYAAADLLMKLHKENEALTYFYLGQLRARSDVNKSLDPSARAAIDVLNERYGPPINKYAFSNVEKLKEAVSAVLRLDRELPRNYDPRWVALHGMQAFTKSNVQFRPETEWKTIDEKTRKDYRSGFQQAMKSLE